MALSHEDRMAARQRMLDSQRLTALIDPHRFSPDIAREAQRHYENQGLRQHEIDILRQQGLNEVRKQEAIAAGLRGQGAETAEIQTRGLTEAERIKAGSAESIARINSERDLEIEKNKGLTAKELENIKADSQYDIANISGEWAHKTEMERTKKSLAEARAQSILAQINNQAALDKIAEQNKGKFSVATLNSMAKFIDEAIRANPGKPLSEIMAEIKEANKFDQEKLRALDSIATSTDQYAIK